MAALQIYDPRDRALVAAADVLLGIDRTLRGFFRQRSRPTQIRRVLLLRLERIGDLLMAMPAISEVQSILPEARIDLVVGSWNREIAAGIPGVSRVITMDAGWLARDGTGAGLRSLVRQARAWRGERYDLGINFEPDVRSNLLLSQSGARWTAGYLSGGGGPLLDEALEYDPARHTEDNARRLVETVLGARGGATPPRLEVPAHHRDTAAALLAGRPSPRVAMHVPGGREVKQWPVERFAAVARELISRRGATVVLTGAAADRRLIDEVRATLPASHVVDASGSADLLTVAGLLAQVDLMITGDTGPMHLAAAVGTPIVAVFGPSDPARYAPRGPHDRIMRVDLPCAPCNRIRLPPSRCTGHTPDCLVAVDADRVLAAALQVLDECGVRDDRHAATSPRPIRA